jgi:hypothetical protein
MGGFTLIYLVHDFLSITTRWLLLTSYITEKFGGRTSLAYFSLFVLCNNCLWVVSLSNE